MPCFTDTELLRAADPERTVAVFELRIGGAVVSRQFVYFDAAKSLAWPEPRVRARLRQDGSRDRRELGSAGLARAAWADAAIDMPDRMHPVVAIQRLPDC